MKLKIPLMLIMLFFMASIVEGRSSSWSITERYSVTDFDKEGNNIYLGEDNHFYIDKIDLTNKELIIEKFNKKRELVAVIRTGMIYEETKRNRYIRRNENVAVFFDNNHIYLYGRETIDSLYQIVKIDLRSNNREKLTNLKGIKRGSIFGIAYNIEAYDEEPWDDGDESYQMKLAVRENKILLDGYYASEGTEVYFVHDYYIFSRDGTLLNMDYENKYLPDKYPVVIKENGEIVKGILAENEMEKLAKELGYTIKEGWTLYRGFKTTDLYIDNDNIGWLSKDLLKSGATKRSDLNYVSAIYGLIQKDGRWKVKEFINPENFPELKYNVFIDRILKAEGNKLWLWVRIGHDITEAYEKRHFDREIWVIEKQ